MSILYQVLMKNKISGIYGIKNNLKNRIYIGSSKNIERRIKTHKQHLEKGCHNCRLMQKHYDENKEAFEFFIVEDGICEDYLKSYERFYINKYNALSKMYGYNERYPTLDYVLYKEIRDNIILKKERNEIKND